MAERILLIQPRWLGDVLLCTPAIREARRVFPASEIDFLTERPGAEVLRGNPYLTRLLVDDRTIRSAVRIGADVIRRRYDAVVDFRSTGSTARLSLLSGAPLRVGVRGRGPSNLVYTKLIEPMPLTKYAARYKLEMLRPLGVVTDVVDDLSLDLTVSPDAVAVAAEFWRRNDLEGAPVVAVSAVSRVPYKNWGAARWADVIDALSAAGARVLLTHGPGEEDQVAAVLAMRPGSGALTFGGSSIENLAAVLARCVLWVGNDGGSKHVAVAMRTPTITVSRWQIGPVWTDLNASIPHSFIDREPPGGCDLDCERCAHRGCLTTLGPPEVIAPVLGALPNVTRRS